LPIDSVKWAPVTPANPRGRKADFVDHIDAELTEAIGVHDGLVSQWIKWLDLYRAPARQPERNIPYENASNFMLPTIATDADQLFAKFMQSLHATENIWVTHALNERWVEAAKPLQDFLTWLDHNVLKMYDVNKRVVGEMVKLGTGIYKHGWAYEKRSVWIYDSRGKAIKSEKIRGAPFVDHVRLADFVFPASAYATDPDVQGGAPWVAERMRVHVDRLRWMAESSSPYLPNIDKDSLNAVIKFEETGVTDWDQAVQSADYDKRSSGAGLDFDTDSKPRHVSGGQPSPAKLLREIELWEVHARFPTQGNDSQDDVIGWYHKPTRRLIRGVYNYYRHGKRPYEVVRYFPGDGFYGIGVCEQTEVFQLMDSDLFNFTWDNVLLANSRMVVAQAGTNIAPGEPFYPNKVWIVDGDIRSSFGVFPMADIYQSLPQLTDGILARKERRNGIGDLQLGNMQSLPSRTPATTTLSLLQEGARRPDLTLKDMRYAGLSTVGLRTLQNCQQFMASPVDVGGKHLLKLALDMLGQPEGSEVAEKILMPLESVDYGVGCSITAVSGSKNKETAKQDYLALMQVSGQVSQQILGYAQIAMQFPGTPLGQLAESAIEAQLELGKRLLEQYDITNIDRIIPETPPESSAFQAPAIPAGLPVGSQLGVSGGASGNLLGQ
jgi:hypothetical protein